MKKLFIRLILLALVIPIVLNFFDEAFFRSVNSSFAVRVVASFFPAATKLGVYSDFPEFVKTVECVEWVLALVSFVLLVILAPCWSEKLRTIFIDEMIIKDGRIQWSIVMAISFMVLLVASDWGLPFISFYTGAGFSNPSDMSLFNAMNSSRLFFSIFAWLTCGGEVVTYYLVATSIFTVLAKVKQVCLRWA